MRKLAVAALGGLFGLIVVAVEAQPSQQAPSPAPAAPATPAGRGQGPALPPLAPAATERAEAVLADTRRAMGGDKFTAVRTIVADVPAVAGVGNRLAALASGQELDANTKALIEEAKKNGISIVADPMIESVAVQRDMLKELQGLNKGGGGRPDEEFASGTRGMRLVKRDMLAKIHAGEGMLVVPRDEMGRMGFRSFLLGSDDPNEGGGSGGGPILSDPVSTSTTSESTSSASVADVEAAVARVISKIQTVQVTNAPQVQIVDNSVVRTVEGQKRFERESVAAIERALDQNARGLESRIERIARRATG
jgi:hypothetical protein